MLKFFWKESEALVRRQARRWQRDPLSHPQLQNMSLRELADLPIPAAWPAPESADCRCR